jgi:KaiC/GvpD/RAD55 family RecA-like ATPase
MYDLTSVLDFEALSAVRPGTSLLISGPAMTGKEALAFDILRDGLDDGEGAVVVTTNDPADAIAERFRADHPDLAQGQLGIVDCRGDGDDGDVDGVYTHHVSSPGDLTGMGIGFTEALETLHRGGRQRGRLALSSLSVMLTYTDKKAAFKFCHVMSSRLDTAEYIGAFTIDSGAHDDQTLQVIKQAFDGMIEIEEAEGGRRVRVLGMGGGPSDWQEL